MRRAPVIVWRRGGLLDVAAGVGAGIDHAGRLEPPPDLEIPGGPFALQIGRAGSAAVGALGPGEPEPAEVLNGGRGELGPTSWAVEVFDPEHDPGLAGPLGGDGKRAGMPHMQQARGRWGEATAAAGHISHHAPVASTYSPRARFVAAWQRMQSIGFLVVAAIMLTTLNQPTAAIASPGWLSTA